MGGLVSGVSGTNYRYPLRPGTTAAWTHSSRTVATDLLNRCWLETSVTLNEPSSSPPQGRVPGGSNPGSKRCRSRKKPMSGSLRWYAYLQQGGDWGATPQMCLSVPRLLRIQEQARSPRWLHLGWHCEGRSCRIVFAAAAQENLDDLVDDEQGDGKADAEQPLAAAQ